ncbi:MAG: RsbRD N-terminal domain-containing protein [Tahibacter sp.]
MTNREDSHEAASESLADFLQGRREALLNNWLAQASRDSDVPSESLTKLQLIDHVPKIFDAVIEAFRRQRSDATMEQVKDVTARHTIIRWAENYDLRAVLREVSLLRAEFVRHVLAFDEQPPDRGSEARLRNSMTLHRILDDIVMDAADTFLNLSARSDSDGLPSA